MANGLLDLLMQARESGRGARADLENSINYYIPPELRGLLGFAAEANPVVSMERAGQDSQQLFAPDQTLMDRLAAGGRMASNMAGVLAPMAAGRAVGMPAVRAAQEGLLGLSMTPEAAALRQFGGDEFGGFTLNQGSPHNFSAERFVRMPDGSTQYVVGAPDVLPDVPAGAEVLRDFPLGRQRMDKIGTGEGAQAYGYGLYNAEAEDVARGYRDALSPTLQSKIWEGVNQDGMRWSHINQIARDITEIVDNEGLASLDEYAPPKGFEDAWARGVAAAKANADSTGGKIYEVNINADPADFLDWDLPLSAQPMAVQNALAPMVKSRLDALEAAGQRGRQMAAEKGLPDFTPKSRERLYQEMRGGDIIGAARTGQLQGNVEDILSEAGIPGIRYLDAGSRSADEGSRNYVMFDENLIDIVRKYGIAGAAAMLGASQADVAQAMQQQQQRPQGLLSGPQ